MEIFGRSRRQLAYAYALIMGVFLAVIIFVMHMAMNWSMFSEQAQELSDAADGVAEVQNFYLQNPNAAVDENRYFKSANDRLFFYIFSTDKQLIRFERASFRIEPFVLSVIESWSIDDGEVEVFRHSNETGQINTVMMTSRKISADSEQIIFVGKDVTALYSGLEKATYGQVFLGFVALVIASGIGYHMAGRALVPLKEAYDKQKQFAADASHELRTPLAVVMASADLLLADPSIQNPFLRQVLEDLKSEVKKMTNLVSDLLMVARSDNNALKFKIQHVDVTELIAQVVRTMKPIAEKKNILLVGEEFSRKVFVNCDEQKIKQLAIILVDNAIKYTTSGGSVLVRFENADNTQTIFSVADSGIGIAEEDLDKVFERFYRVDKARSREMGGNGLGLAIAAEIVKLHDGKISVASKLGEGTKFTVTLKTNLQK